MTSSPRPACFALPVVAMFVAGCPRDHLAADAGDASRSTVAPAAADSGAALAPAITPTPAPARRAIAPRPGTVTSVLRPRLRVTPGVDVIDLCRTRACEAPQRVAADPEGRAIPAAELAPGTWFWRVAAGGGAPPGPLWSIVVRKAAGHSSRVHGFDPNGDGIADVPIEASLLFGSAGTLADKLTRVPHAQLDAVSAEPPAARSPATLIEPAGDVDGDGFDDAVLGERILRGGPAGMMPEAAWLGCPAGGCGRAVGDVNDDGYADLEHEGNLQLGSRSGLRVVVSPLTAGAEYVRAALDLDGDGIADLAILSKDHTSLSVLRGGRAGLSAGASAKLMLPKGEDTGVQLELGDIDGDGTNDLVLLASERAGASGGLRATVIVRFTPPGGDIAHSSERRLEVPIPPQAGKSPSAQLFVADVDGDGFDDAVVFFGGPHAGRARVIRGSKGALRVEAESVGFSPKDDVSGADFFSVGDVNGDGHDDVLFVGVPSAGFVQAFDLFKGAKNGLEPRPFASYTMFAGQRVPAKR